jgi:small-conductance mechanosensitive channel
LFFFLIGLLFILNALGISITPIITALGIGGLAVALALQDTLNNLFSGFYITLSQQMRVGDYIQLENGSEGWVKDIGWRNTTLLLVTNSYVIIPNSKLAQNIITNYSLPDKRVQLKISFGAAYESDIDHVEKSIISAVREITPRVPGIMSESAPVVLFNPGPESFSLVFTLSVFVDKYADRGPIISEIKKAVFLKFREEKINIPFPIQTIHLKKEN